MSLLHNYSASTYFIDEVWDLLVTETNQYASLHFPSRQHARHWTGVSIEEMKADNNFPKVYASGSKYTLGIYLCVHTCCHIDL